MPNPNHRFLVAIFALCVVHAVCTAAHGATCNAGYYLDNGECTVCTTDIWLAVYCPGDDMKYDCPRATALADRVTGYWYWSDGMVHDSVGGCRADINPNDPRGDYQLSCAICDGDYGVNKCRGTECMARYPENCISGYAWSTPAGQPGNPNRNAFAFSAEKMKEAACVPVGAGYYSPDGDIERTECPAGLTTIGFGTGADEVADCGHALHIGDTTVHLRSEKKTTPSLNVQIDDQVFYGNMSTEQHGKLRINMNGTMYSVYDDTM